MSLIAVANSLFCLIMRQAALRLAARYLYSTIAFTKFSSRPFHSAESVRSAESVYSGPRSSRPITLRTLQEKYRKGELLSMVTAYDYPSAVHLENSNVDFILVGDSAAMVVHGHETTLPITLDEMITHCKAVVRGASRPLIIGDMPFGSYEQSEQQAVASATRMLKEGQVDAVKMEGGTESRVRTVRSLTEAGIAVMGHIGLTPQMISVIGGFRPQAQIADSAMETVKQGKALEEAGCFALVLECVPAAVGAALQEIVNIPIIGIGAGPACAGQVLVFHDLLGYVQHPHHAKVTPKFCKRYCEVGKMIDIALTEFNNDVKEGTFPGKEFSPYQIKQDEVEKFCLSLKDAGMTNAADAAFKQFERHRSDKKD